jgi:HPt (histidine-containing phosphotransfer) domain-containing protein
MNNGEQEAILALLGENLRELVTADAEHGAAASERLANWESHCEHLHNAMNMAGLAGLGAVCHWLHDNMRTLAKAGIPLAQSEAAVQKISNWPKRLDEYLQTFLIDRFGANEQLLDFLELDAWPLPLTPALRERLRQELSDLEFDLEEQRNELPTEVERQMVSLAVPGEVRSELLQGLLLELPEQVRGFEHAIAAYAASGADRHLDSAQRLAHTIKGAANVVGIAGLANLMHFAEDLLVIAALHKSNLTASFVALLMDLGDCLATSADYLCGLSPPGQSCCRPARSHRHHSTAQRHAARDIRRRGK